MKKIKFGGFTLIELLVALLILAIISVILVAGLRNTMNTKSRIDDVSTRLANMQVAMSIISNDIRQMVNRPVQDNDGKSLAPLILYSGVTNSLEFTRDGYINPNGVQLRSTLQRVSYRLVNGNLERGTWDVLDRSNSTPAPNYQILIPNVTNLQWKFFSGKNTVYTQWPSPQIWNPLPQGVELIITIKNWGTFQSWFVVENYYPTMWRSTGAFYLG